MKTHYTSLNRQQIEKQLKDIQDSPASKIPENLTVFLSAVGATSSIEHVFLPNEPSSFDAFFRNLFRVKKKKVKSLKVVGTAFSKTVVAVGHREQNDFCLYARGKEGALTGLTKEDLLAVYTHVLSHLGEDKIYRGSANDYIIPEVELPKLLENLPINIAYLVRDEGEATKQHFVYLPETNTPETDRKFFGAIFDLDPQKLQNKLAFAEAKFDSSVGCVTRCDNEDKDNKILFTGRKKVNGKLTTTGLNLQQIKNIVDDLRIYFDEDERGSDNWSALIAYPGQPPQQVTVREAKEIQILIAGRDDPNVEIEFLADKDLPGIIIAVDKAHIAKGKGFTQTVFKRPVIFFGENEAKDGFTDLTNEQKNAIVEHCSKRSVEIKPAKVSSTRETFYERKVDSENIEKLVRLGESLGKPTLEEVIGQVHAFSTPENSTNSQIVFATAWLKQGNGKYLESRKALSNFFQARERSTFAVSPAISWLAFDLGFHLSRHHESGCRVYDIDSSLAVKLRDTKLQGLRGEDFRLPFRSICILIPKELEFKVWNADTGWHVLEEIYISEDVCNGKNDVNVLFLGEDRPGEGDAVYWFHVDLNDAETIEEGIRKVDLLDGKKYDRSVRKMKEEWVRIFQWIVNLVLYVTNSDPGEHALANPEARKLWSKIDAMPFGSRKRKGLEAKVRAAGIKKQERLVLRQSEIQIARNRAESQGQGDGTHRKLTMRVRVQGHWRNVRVGIGRTERRKKWIEPFWRGPDIAEIFAKRRVLKEVGK